jgi:hypothetical protein
VIVVVVVMIMVVVIMRSFFVVFGVMFTLVEVLVVVASLGVSLAGRSFSRAVEAGGVDDLALNPLAVAAASR